MRALLDRCAPLLIVFVVLALAGGGVAVAAQLDRDGCATMAIWGRDLIWARDMGADREKVRNYLEKSKEEGVVFKVLLPMFDALWTTKMDRVEVMNGLYRECIARRGNFGTDT